MDKDFTKDKNMILDVYKTSFKEYGPCPMGITWGTEKSQTDRFKVLTEISDLTKSSILDFGCGMGDLYGYLSKNTDVDLDKYLGIDINDVLLEEAGKRYPKANFILRDILKDSFALDEKFDFVFASGVFAIPTPNWKDFTYQLLDELFKSCRKAMAINFLTTYSKTDTGSNYVDPCSIFKMACDRYSTKLVMRQDYKDNDFTMYIYKVRL